MVRLVLISAVALAGCYSPPFADCTTTCGTSGICPGDLACTNGFCREPGAPGTCPGAQIDAPVDASIDAARVCPPAPIGMSGCASAPTPVLVGGGCYTLCNPATTGTIARSFMAGGWRPASVHTQNEQDAVVALAAGAIVYFGLYRPENMSFRWIDSSPLDYTNWQSGTAPGGTNEQCGVLTPGGWNAELCSNMHPFLIRTPLPP